MEGVPFGAHWRTISGLSLPPPVTYKDGEGTFRWEEGQSLLSSAQPGLGDSVCCRGHELACCRGHELWCALHLPPSSTQRLPCGVAWSRLLLVIRWVLGPNVCVPQIHTLKS